jgi:hypothetical protein
MEEVEQPDPKNLYPGYLQMHTMISLTDDCSMDNSQRSIWYTSSESKDNDTL